MDEKEDADPRMMKPTTTIFTPPPSITHVCKQARHETLRMYFSSTDFIVHVEERYWTQNTATKSSYDKLLDLLSEIGPDNVHAIKSLTIVCNDPHMGPRRGMAHRPTAVNVGLIPLWNKFIPDLLARGLRPSQLRWPGLLLDADQAKSATYLTLRLVRLAILYEAVIVPSLRKHGCIDPENPPPELIAQVSKLPRFIIGHCPSHDVARGIRLFDAARREEERANKTRHEKLGGVPVYGGKKRTD
jgi:hypothetical protein